MITSYRRLPVRMNPIEVRISVRSMARSIKDPYFKQIVGRKSEEIVVFCQNRRFTAEQQRVTVTGDAINTIGHLVFRKVDYDNDKLDLKKGDRIVVIDGETVDYDIIEINRKSPLGGHNLLVFVEYGRSPERSSS